MVSKWIVFIWYKWPTLRSPYYLYIRYQMIGCLSIEVICALGILIACILIHIYANTLDMGLIQSCTLEAS